MAVSSAALLITFHFAQVACILTASRAHLIHDLRPYICTYEDCRSVNQLYGNKADWVQHEASHATTWRCPVHPKEVFDNLVAFRLHATDGHVQNALIKGSIHEIVVAESVYKTRRSCPVCTVSDLSAAQLDNHVAAHLERLAIFSLPKHAGMVEADDDGQDSNEAKAEEDLRGLDMESGFRFDSAPAAMLDEKSSSDTSSRTSRGSVDTRVLVTGTDWTSKATSYSAVYNPPIRQRIAYQVTQHVTSRNHLDSMQRPAVRGSSRPTQAKASGPAIQQVARGQADEAPDEYPLKRNEREVRSESSYADEEYPFTTLRSRTCRLFVQIPPDELGQRLDFLEDNQRILDKEVVDSIQDQIFDQAVDFSRMSKLVPMMSCVYCLALIQVSKTRRSERLPALFQRLRTPSSEEKQDYNDKVTSVLKAIQDMKSTRRDASIPQSQKPAQRERGGQVHVDPRAGTRVQDAKQLPLRGRVVSHQQQMLEAADDVDTLDLTAIFEGRLTNENNIAAAEVKDLDSSPLEDVRLLSSKYKEQNSPRTFFRPGRVFAILWHEGVGESSSKKATDALMEPKPSDKFNSGTTVARGRYNEPVFGHIQRMVVINTRRASCWCVSIGTYGGRGLTKKGLLKDEINAHAIIYDVERGVQSLKNEPSTKQRPIGVKMAEGESLDIASRVHLGKPYIVETNLKVMNVGQVVPKDLEYLLTAIKIELGLA